ncbi:MAG: efflux RND transporter periplasmic adaptor subunit [Gemmatimonadota bacterium]|nr:efflux RND transporter periplasmic adaptor subunit [Gemmatimonadota bacterium]
MKKRLVIAGVSACSLVAVLLYLVFSSTARDATFRILQVRHGTISEILAETGTIQFVRTVMVKPTISGEVRHIHADVGDRVSAGDVLAVIEPDPSQSLQLSRQRARVDGARIDLSERELNFERKRALHERSLISAEEFDQARIAHTRARHDLDMAELELRILELKVNVEVDSNQTHDAVRVLSPLDGLVIARAVEEGEVVASGTSSYTGGTEMFRIGDPDRMIVKSAIGEIDAGRVRPGQDVRIRVDAYPDAMYHGRVERVAPVGVRRLGSTLVTFDAEIVISDPSMELQQGMSCDIDIVLEKNDHSVLVPASSVMETADNRGAFIDQNDPAQTGSAPGRRHMVYRCTSAYPELSRCSEAYLESAMVEIGIESTDNVEILSGIEPGAHIARDARAVHAALNAQHP